MKITAPREALASALVPAARAAAPGAGEVMSRMRLEVSATDSGATLTATGGDTERAIRTRVAVTAGEGLGNDEKIVVSVPAQLTATLIKDLRGDTVELDISDDEVTVNHDSGTYRIPRFADEGVNYPFATSNTPIVIGGSELADVVSRVATAASKDVARGALTAVKFEVNGEKISFVATDSYRLAVFHIAAPAGTEAIEAKIPATSFDAAAKLLAKSAEVKVLVDDRVVTLDGGDIVVSAVQRTGNYPAWQLLLKNEPALDAVIEPSVFADKVRLASKFASILDFTFDPAGTVTITGSGVGSVTETCPCEFNGKDEFTIRFNAAYLLDALTTTIGEKITLKVKDATSPVWVRGAGDQVTVVMPMR